MWTGKYKFYQFQKRERQTRDFDKEFFKPKSSHWTVSNSVKAYSIQANEIFHNWKPPVFQLKSLPHFSHLYVVSSSTNHPQCEGYVFYNNVRDSMGSSLSNISILNSSRVAAHQSTDLSELRKGILLERKHTSSTIAGSVENVHELEFTKNPMVGISLNTPPPAQQSPIPPNSGTPIAQSSTKILSKSTSQLNMAGTGTRTFAATLSKGNLNSSTGTVVVADQNIVDLHMDDLYRIIQRNYFSFCEFVLYSPLLIERSVASKDPELYFPANMTVRQYITDIVLSKYHNMTKNPEINEIWMEYIETFEKCKYVENCGKARAPPLTESDFTVFLGHIHMLLNLRYK